MTQFIDVAHFVALFVLRPATSKLRLGSDFNVEKSRWLVIAISVNNKTEY